MKNTKIVIFCGGRGSKHIIDLLSARRDVDLTLLVNAYDDGLSTGALRRLIPGMLGPSDFRKNLSYLISLYSDSQYDLKELIEYRLQAGANHLLLVSAVVMLGDLSKSCPDTELAKLICRIDKSTRIEVKSLLEAFLNYIDSNQHLSFNFEDCSFGNLIFAGAFLRVGGSFNTAIEEMGRLCGSKSKLVNVSKGECYTLCGLKVDGSILKCEAEVVGVQNASPIKSIFFAPPNPVDEEIDEGLIEAVKANPRYFGYVPDISIEAKNAIKSADIIIYGSGTQHSSLLPSYIIAKDVIKSTNSALKVFIANLKEDYDINGLCVNSLVDNALKYLDDHDNKNSIDLILFNDGKDGYLQFENLNDTNLYKSAKVIKSNFTSGFNPDAHSSLSVCTTILSEYLCKNADKSFDFYCQPNVKTPEESLWRYELSEVENITGIPLNKFEISYKPKNFLNNSENSYKNEVAMFKDWIMNRSSLYFVTVLGDGVYSMYDLIPIFNVFKIAPYDMIIGCRTQSRSQHNASLKNAYGESSFLYYMSLLGGLLVTALLLLRTKLVISDPLTGLKVYKRTPGLSQLAVSGGFDTCKCSVDIFKALIRANLELAEVPVSYVTYKGFAEPTSRIKRGLMNLANALK